MRTNPHHGTKLFRALAVAFALAVGTACLAGCKKDAPAGVEDAGPAAAPATPAAPAADGEAVGAAVGAAAAGVAATSGAGPGRGLSHPANDPGLVTAARPIADCPSDKRIDTNNCPALAELERVVRGVDPVLAFDTLLRFLDEPSPAIRFAGAELLRQRTWPGAVRSDPERLGASVDALATETDRGVAEALGTLVGRFRLDDFDVRERVLTALREHPLPEARKGLLYHLVFSNPDDRQILDAVREAAETDRDLGVRRSALAAFWNLGPERKDVVVPIWRRAVHVPEEEVAAKAAYLLGHWQKGVEDGFPDVVGETRRRGAEGTISWEFLSGLLWYLNNGQDFVDRQAVFDAAQVVVANRDNTWMARNKALDLMKKAGPDRFEAAVEPFAADPEPMVARHVKLLLGP